MKNNKKVIDENDNTKKRVKETRQFHDKGDSLSKKGNKHKPHVDRIPFSRRDKGDLL